MKKTLMILILVSLGIFPASSVFAQDFRFQYNQYKYESWKNIWVEKQPVESTVGGDAWKVGGKWVTGHFTRNGVWVRPGRRWNSQGPRGWYTPGWGTSWHERHTHNLQPGRWMGCR